MKKSATKLVIVGALIACKLAQAADMHCPVNQGLILIYQAEPPIQEVKDILKQCDNEKPNNSSVLLLHGLLARTEGMATQNYTVAITWLEKASKAAAANDLTPSLELALTYEWAAQPEQAKVIYTNILAKQSFSRQAMLGLARVAIAGNDLTTATTIYQKLLGRNAYDIEALNGMGRIDLVNHDYAAAKANFDNVLKLKDNDADALSGLVQIKQAETPIAAEEPVVTIKEAEELQIGPFCQVNKGLEFMGLVPPPLKTIEKILVICDKQVPNNMRVLLLHGILARQQAIKTKQWQPAIAWLLKAIRKAPYGNQAPLLELAVTYEWAQDIKKAKAIYAGLLKKNPRLRAALLGSARMAVATRDAKYALDVYNRLLQKNPDDIDALNGIARAKMASGDFMQARLYFNKVLQIKSDNLDAKTGLEQIKAATSSATVAIQRPQPPVCEANEGLRLLNQPRPPYQKIYALLAKCDKNVPNDVQVLLLHGLLARQQAIPPYGYQDAITWLQKAAQVATPDNLNPALALAVTYEWAEQPERAQAIYNDILSQNPASRPALLGTARIDRVAYRIRAARCIYQHFLQQNPHDQEALNGMSWLQLTNKEFTSAKAAFEKALAVNPNDADAKLGLQLLQEITRYTLSINEGRYLVTGSSSYTTNINYYADINATDQFILQLAHNSNEIQLSLVLDPTILPKNSGLVGFQRQYPDRYGWGLNYEYRERTKFRVEHRLGVNANYFLLRNVQWYGGAREGLPSPWNNRLFYAGFTFFTSLPVNFTTTGYWGRQQFGGSTSAYSIDLSKEFSNRAYYDLGTSYSPSQLDWEVHGRFIYPITKNQAIEGVYGHYFVINTTNYSLGWRFYL